MPGGIEETQDILRFIAEDISRESYVNIMDQYRPLYRASECSEINRRITAEEYEEALVAARRYGLHRGFDQ